MRNAPIKSQKGFTLIEILVVIAILAILAAVVFAALNPVGRFQDSRNSTRRTNVESILQAIRLYTVDNNGSYPAGIVTLDTGNFSTSGSNTVPLCKVPTANIPPDTQNPGGGTGWSQAWTASPNCTAASALATALVPKYIQSIPTDPSNSSGNYYIGKTTDGQHVVVANFDMESGTTSQFAVFYLEN